LFRLTELTDKGIIATDLVPTKVVGIAYNWKKLCDEFVVTAPSEPLIFLKPVSALIGDKGTILYPPQLRSVFFETELAVIIGERATRVPVEDAYRYIYGYSVIQDISDYMLEETCSDQGMDWTVSKGFDTFAPIYHVVKKERVGDPHRLDLSLKVNGVLKQSGNTRNMIFKCDQLVSYISHIMTLEPGDIIAAGCPEGCDLIEPGDVLESTIQNIGTLTVTVKKVHDFPASISTSFMAKEGKRYIPFSPGTKLYDSAVKKGLIKPK